MKIYFISALLLLSTLVYAQQNDANIQGGLFAGLATTQIDGDGYGGFNKAGLLGGGYVNTRIAPKWRAEMAISYIQKGSIDPYRPDKNDFEYYRIRLSYVEVPLMFRSTYKSFTYGIGPSLGVLIASSEEDINGEVNVPFHAFKSTEIGANFDLLFKLLNRLEANVRYTHSALPISNETKFTRFGLIGGSYSMALNFSLRYRLSKD